MLYDELCELISDNRELPTYTQYKEIIEVVYAWHPLNFDKKAIAKLWDDFGLVIFEDLHPRARMALCIECKEMSKADKEATYELIQDDLFMRFVEEEVFGEDDPTA